MNVRPIRTEGDYVWALAEIERYLDDEPELGSEDGDRLQVLIDLVSAYEDRTIPLPQIDPIDALKAFMDMHGRGQSDLAVLLGSRSRASEILNRKRALTLDMVHRLHREWGVPAELVVAPYTLAA